MSQVCPVCSSSDVKHHRNLHDDRFAYPGEFELVCCGNCGHKFLAGEFTPEMLIRMYSDYYPRSNMKLEDFTPLPEIKGFRDWLRGEFRAYSAVPRNVRVLDIGCGFGESLAYHQARGCEVYGVEADTNIKRVAEKFGFNVHVGVFEPDLYEENFFDYITMDQVIEHVIDPIETLSGIARVLKPGGRLVMTTPNSNGWGVRAFGDKWIHWHCPYHLQQYSRKSMKLAAKKTGFTVERSPTITSSEWLFYQRAHSAAYPEKGKPHPFWQPANGNEPTEEQSAVIARARRFHTRRFKPNHLITRFFDMLRVGDNYFFSLRKNP